MGVPDPVGNRLAADPERERDLALGEPLARVQIEHLVLLVREALLSESPELAFGASGHSDNQSSRAWS